MTICAAGGAMPAGVDDLIAKAKAVVPQPRREVRQVNGQIMLVERRGSTECMVGDCMSLEEARDLSQALVQFGGAMLPSVVLKLALAVVVLSGSTVRAS
jgi:hypothetical protein